MEEFLVFFQNYGLVLGFISLAGVVVLAVLKYCKVFNKIENETARHYVYIITSVGLSLIGTAIYLVCTNAWNWAYFFTVATAIWALNQTFYNIFKTTKLNDLVKKIMDFIVAKIKALPESKKENETDGE